MIFLTGDVHHIDRRMKDQRLAVGETEVTVAERYLEIANDHGIVPTLFFTGLAANREAPRIAQLIRNFEFEVGGHTYSANRHRWLLAGARRLFGLANGPRWLQKRDMVAAIRALQDGFGVNIASWRNHAYRMDQNTYPLAAELGIGHVSNVVTGVETGIRVVQGILEIPINTLPDHESLGHDSHPRTCAGAQAWAERVLKQVEYQQSRGLPSVILAHPLCMFIEDRFQAFEHLCKGLRCWRSARMAEANQALEKQRAASAHWD